MNSKETIDHPVLKLLHGSFDNLIAEQDRATTEAEVNKIIADRYKIKNALQVYYAETDYLRDTTDQQLIDIVRKFGKVSWRDILETWMDKYCPRDMGGEQLNQQRKQITESVFYLFQINRFERVKEGRAYMYSLKEGKHSKFLDDVRNGKSTNTAEILQIFLGGN